MKQTKISLKEEEILFLETYRSLGFKDKSEMVRSALDRMKKALLAEELKASAELYAELYENDQDLQQLTESAVSEWPE